MPPNHANQHQRDAVRASVMLLRLSMWRKQMIWESWDPPWCRQMCVIMAWSSA